MISLADAIRAETGVELRIVGFDAGAGLPVIEGFRDHPELWSVGDFSMTNKEELERRVAGRAELIFGDIKDTVDAFVSTLEDSAPLGFVSIDVDIYSGTRSALRCLLGRPELYVPAVSIYCDDVQFFFANRWCGELRRSRSSTRRTRCGRSTRTVACRRKASGDQAWHRAMFVCHVLDHDLRTRPRPEPASRSRSTTGS